MQVWPQGWNYFFSGWFTFFQHIHILNIILSSRPWKQIWSRTSWNYLKALASKIWTVQQPLRLRLLKPSRPWLEACSMENRWVCTGWLICQLQQGLLKAQGLGSGSTHTGGSVGCYKLITRPRMDSQGSLLTSEKTQTRHSCSRPGRFFFYVLTACCPFQEEKCWNSSAMKNNKYLVLMKFNFQF